MQTASASETDRSISRPASGGPGLRERKKRETRKTIAAAALDLFSRQGFQNTTIAQIAEAADVAPRTVSSYFPVKEELAFPDQRQMIKDLRHRLATRSADVDALEALRRWIDASLSGWEKEAEELYLTRRVIEAEPELRAYERVQVGQIMDALRAEIARDLDCDADALEPRMAAAATMAVFEVIGDHFKQGPPPADEAGRTIRRDQVRQQVDRAIRFVAAGIKELEKSR